MSRTIGRVLFGLFVLADVAGAQQNPREPLLVSAQWLKEHLKDPNVVILHVGDDKKFGAGHIPGAKSIPFNSLNDETGKLKPASDLRDIFTKAGIQPGDTVVAYCHVGQQATAVIFAARTLGHPVKLFDGSWDEWNRRTEFPVEVPPKK